jgi:hypothetical protein
MPSPPLSSSYGRARVALQSTLLVVIALLASHRGEFWPFSIYPMFSRAGRPFTHALVRELAAGESYGLAASDGTRLPGKPVALVSAGISQNDLSALVARASEGHLSDAQAIGRLFMKASERGRLLVYAVRGELQGSEIELVYTPVVECSHRGFALLTRGAP